MKAELNDITIFDSVTYVDYIELDRELFVIKIIRKFAQFRKYFRKPYLGLEFQ